MQIKSMIVKMNTISHVSGFVQYASRVDGDVVVQKGRWVIDGKSLMGMFSLDLTTGVKVEYPADAVEFEEFISKFKAD